MTQRVNDEEIVGFIAQVERELRDGELMHWQQEVVALCHDLRDERQSRRAAEAQLKTVLDREAESQCRHDAKLTQYEAVVKAGHDLCHNVRNHGSHDNWKGLATALSALEPAR